MPPPGSVPLPQDMLDEMWSYMAAITRSSRRTPQRTLRHFVLASDAVAYNLGGDLDLFTRLIREGNRDLPLNYAQRCVEGAPPAHRVRRRRPFDRADPG
jgi:DSF synthase